MPIDAQYADVMAKARVERDRQVAIRAIDDPVKLAKAARIVRAALERNRLTLADLDPQGEGDHAAA